MNTKLLSLEYMQVHRNLIPEEIKLEYNTAEFTDQDGYVYIKVTLLTKIP